MPPILITSGTMIPRQLGPMIRAPRIVASSTICATSRRGIRSVTTTMSLMPFSIASKTASFVNAGGTVDRKSTRLNSSHANISYAVFCLKKTTRQGAREQRCKVASLVVALDLREDELDGPLRGESLRLQRVRKAEPADRQIGPRRTAALE